MAGAEKRPAQRLGLKLPLKPAKTKSGTVPAGMVSQLPRGRWKEGAMTQPQEIESEDKDLTLREDIRLLGRILGDTIREQSGEAVYDTVENIRQNSVRFRRDEDLTARRDLEATLNSLKPKDALQIIRAFGFFSHLANIAEDQHHILRTRAHSLSAATPREGTLAHSLARAHQAGIPTARL